MKNTRWKLLRWCGIAIFGYFALTFLVFAMLVRADAPSSPPTGPAATVAPAPPTSTNQVSIEELQTQVQALQEENKKLEGEIKDNYPTELERNLTHFATAATVFTISFGVLGMVAAVIGTSFSVAAALDSVSSFKKSVVDAAYEKARSTIHEVHELIKARTGFAMGASSGYTAWQRGDWSATPLNYLADQAHDFSKEAYQKFKTLRDGQTSDIFKAEITEVLVKALNNTVFYGALVPNHCDPVEMAELAEELKSLGSTDGSPHRINTYLFARIEFPDGFATFLKLPLADIDTETGKQLNLQGEKNLLENDRNELNRLIHRFNDRQGLVTLEVPLA